MKKIWFKNSRGQKLVGILHEARKEKAVIMAHGFKSDKDEDGIFIRAADALCKERFAVLRFDFAGSGESEGKFTEMMLSKEVEDLESAILFMKNQGYKKIGLLGASFGGTVSILGHPNGIASMVLWNPVSKTSSFENYLSNKVNRDWKKEIEKGYLKLYSEKRSKSHSISKNMILEMEKINFQSESRKIKAPILIIHGENDSYLPFSDSQELLRFLKEPKKLEIIKNAEHGFHDPDSEKIAINLTVNWFKKYL
jgi:putative redox protein